MNIGVITDMPGCGPVVFDNAQLALAFVRMIAHTLTPDLFVGLVHKLVPSPDAVDMAKRLVLACMGQPA